jgi:CheY-like chemotaxis protein
MRCLVVDDNYTFLDAARSLLEMEDIEVVAIAGSSSAAISLVARLQPDVALVDINLGSESGFALATSLADPIGRAPTPIILMSTHAEDD